MSARVSVRLADPVRDAERILRIYAPYIEKTAITFETVVPEASAFEARVRGIAAQFPYLVLELDGEMIGYAYAHRQAERASFDWNAELSIYLKEGFETLIKAGGVSVIHPDILTCGGALEMKKIADVYIDEGETLLKLLK